MQAEEARLRQRWVDSGDWQTIQEADPMATVVPGRGATMRREVTSGPTVRREVALAAADGEALRRETAPETARDAPPARAAAPGREPQAQPASAAGPGTEPDAPPLVPRQVPVERGGPPIEMLERLGEGGMGLIFRGRDRALHRFVAVKTLRPERVDDTSTADLLQEARLTGMLEHPNIVPIYQLSADADGVPFVVMKEIRGVSWRSVLSGDVPLDPRVADPMDSLVWHLEVLLRVCHALEYAHDRKVLHRDIKPENVMIGYFGEIYLLDWGIAVSFDEGLHGVVPLAREQTKIAGTFSYMAPEMAAGDATQLGVRSDVFLLGAALHEILTGEPPHQGDNPYLVLIAAYRATPKSYPESVPAELAAIARRAMAPRPEDRFATVHELAAELRAFLRHRSSIRLAERGLLQLARLEDDAGQRCAAGPRELPTVLQEFAELRFAFRQALNEWPQNERARDGLQRGLAIMAERAVARCDASAARIYLDECVPLAPDGESGPPPSLIRAVEELEAEQAGKDRAIAELRRELDTELGVSQRMLGETVIGVSWFVGCVALALVNRFTSLRPSAWYLYGLLAFLGLVSLVIYGMASKEAVRPNELVRRAVLAGIASGTVAGVIAFFLAYNQVTILVAAVQLMLTLGGMMIAVGLIAEPRITAAGIVYLACGSLAGFWLSAALELLAVSELLVVPALLVVDRRLRMRAERASQPTERGGSASNATLFKSGVSRRDDP